MRPPAGTLNRRVTIQEPDTAQDATGDETIQEWRDVDTVSARITPLAGRPLELARSIVSTATHTVEIRFRNDVFLDMRFLYGDRILEIGDIQNPTEQNEMFVITCTEVVEQ